MRIALHTVVAASRKEPPNELVGRVRKAFLDAGLGQPSTRFTLTDAAFGKGVSAIDRTLKRYPEMERSLTRQKMARGLEGARMLSNAATGEPAEYATLEAIAPRIPRSLPFHGVGLHFYAAEFGERLIGLPPTAEARDARVLAGPRKPALKAAFKPMGYSCTGGSGVFHLTRQTQQNLTVELYLDGGTWSHSVSASYLINGAGFQSSVGVPVAPEVFGQYLIGDAERWKKIVENLAAMVRKLERSFVSAVEQAAGPSPAWYGPPS